MGFDNSLIKMKTKNIRIERIKNPKNYFVGKVLTDITNAVRNGFGSEMIEQDIYEHLIKPDDTYLFMKNDDIIGMASTSNINVFGLPTTHLEGIAIAKKFQGHRLGNLLFDELEKQFDVKIRTPVELVEDEDGR